MNLKFVLSKIWGVNKKKLNLILGFLGICYIKKDLPKDLAKNIDLILTNLINSVSINGKAKLKSRIESFIKLKLVKGLRQRIAQKKR